MGTKEKGYFDIVTENSVLELAIQEFNMAMLHDLFETRDYILDKYGHELLHLDGIDQAELTLQVFKMITDYELYNEYSDLTINETFEDEEFEKIIIEYITKFEGTY